MPVVRKLSVEEVRTIERKTVGLRRAIEAEYNRYMQEFAIGDYGEVAIEPNEKRLTVRNRLVAAAQRQDPPVALNFLRTRGDMLRFRIITPEEKRATARQSNRQNTASAPLLADSSAKRRARNAAEAAPTEARKRGRPKRTA